MMTMLYMYPLLTEASISLLLSGNATLLVAFGSLDLVAGGLAQPRRQAVPKGGQPQARAVYQLAAYHWVDQIGGEISQLPPLRVIFFACVLY